ncbi:MAG TPA: flagellar biosynthesis protein FlhB [Alphaproteobacteria bacterium]|nr:flagellar biosynthesis protein FlhB [Alphaproteobacteria bacterium]
MAEEDNDQKTEEPTGKRLEEARDRGQLPLSRETTSWVIFLGILICVAWLAPGMSRRIISAMQVFLEQPHAFSLDDRGLQTVIFTTLKEVAFATASIFIVLAVAAVAGTMTQTGLFASLDLITPDFDKLSWKNGFHRIFSTTALVELGKSIAKMVLLGTAVFFTLLPVINQLPVFTGHSLIDMIAFLHHETVHLIVIMLLVFTAIAVADLFYQRFHYYKTLRMTKAEVKDEFKQQEGDPVIKSRLRQIRLEKARKRMMAQVPKADVVVTNPTHYAIALQYDNIKMVAPVVLAKGTDALAERIKAVAEENKIPFVSNPPLARALYDTVEVDQAIPTQHYRAVAEVISYVYKLKKRKF